MPAIFTLAFIWKTLSPEVNMKLSIKRILRIEIEVETLNPCWLVKLKPEGRSYRMRFPPQPLPLFIPSLPIIAAYRKR